MVRRPGTAHRPRVTTAHPLPMTTTPNRHPWSRAPGVCGRSGVHFLQRAIRLQSGVEMHPDLPVDRRLPTVPTVPSQTVGTVGKPQVRAFSVLGHGGGHAHRARQCPALRKRPLTWYLPTMPNMPKRPTPHAHQRGCPLGPRGQGPPMGTAVTTMTKDHNERPNSAAVVLCRGSAGRWLWLCRLCGGIRCAADNAAV